MIGPLACKGYYSPLYIIRNVQVYLSFLSAYARYRNTGIRPTLRTKIKRKKRDAIRLMPYHKPPPVQVAANPQDFVREA